MKFTLSLYKDTSNRKTVDTLIKNIDSFINDALIPFYKLEILKHVEHEWCLNKVNAVLDENINTFKDFNTEYRRFKIYKEDSIYTEPQEFRIGSISVTKFMNSTKLIQIPKVIHIPKIPVYHTLKTFLELPGVFEEMERYVFELSKDKTVLSNVIQGSLWQKKFPDYLENSIFPLFISFDDFDPANVLGSHSGY